MPLRILIGGTIILLLLDAVLLATVGVLNHSGWMLGGAVLAAGLTLLVVRFGKAYDKRRAEIAASRTELRDEARVIADVVKSSRDS